jgi:hypothetical protein
VLGDELTVTQNRQLVALFEAIAVGLDEGDLGAIDALPPAPDIRKGSLVLVMGVPSGDLPSGLDVFKGSSLASGSGSGGTIEISAFFRSLPKRPSVSATPVEAAACHGSEPRASFIELNDIGEFPRVLFFVVVESRQGCLHDVDAGDVFGNRESIGVFSCLALEFFYDIQQVPGRDVANLGVDGPRTAYARKNRNDE